MSVIIEKNFIKSIDFGATTHSVKYPELTFTFSDEWLALSKVAVFVSENKKVSAEILDDKCHIPDSVLLSSSIKFLGVFGESFDAEGALLQRITTDFVQFSTSPGAYSSELTPQPVPTPSVWEEYFTAISAAANLAQASAGSAQGSATIASEEAITATNKATESESYAIGGTGERENEDTDNSKYYSEQAETSAQTATTKATEASGYADTAGEKAIDSESYAVGGTNSRIGEDTDNASYYATQAGTHAQTAETKATEASGYATTATNKATEAKSYAVGGTATRVNEETDNAYYYSAIASEEASTASDKATESKSYAIGGTSTRTGEDTDNAKYYSEQATATLASKANKAQESWTTATLLNGWTNIDVNYEPAGYMIDEFGFVHLRGYIGGGTAAYCMQVPVGYRIAKTERQPISQSQNNFGVATINTSGLIAVNSAQNNYISLSGIIYEAVRAV